MNKLLESIFVFAAVFFQPSYAQIIRNGRSSSGRTIAGGVIGGLAILFLIFLCCMMARRRRTGGFMAASGPGGNQPTQHGLKPMFGGPWGRSNAAENGANNAPTGPYPNQGPNNNTYNGPQHQSQKPYNPEYPGPNDAAPPPTYGQDADYGRQFSPPQGLPPGQSNNQGLYSSPPGPPPAAHTTGKNNGFVGGFQS